MADGLLGLRGWQWMFLLEGLPSIVLGVYIWATLAARPSEASFLTPPEREAIAEEAARQKVRCQVVTRSATIHLVYQLLSVVGETGQE